MYLVVAALAIGLLIVLYLGFAPGPRRRRAFRRAQRLLEAGSWKESLALVDSLTGTGGSTAWRARLRNCAGECHQRAVDLPLLQSAVDFNRLFLGRRRRIARRKGRRKISNARRRSHRILIR